MISAPTRATFEIATIMKTIDTTLIIDVELSKKSKPKKSKVKKSKPKKSKVIRRKSKKKKK